MSADLESRLRALPERLADLHPRADLADVVRGRQRQRRRRRMASAAAAAAAVLVGTTVAVGAGRDSALPPTAPPPIATASPAPPRGPAPTDPRLLRWPTRGPLAGDAAERAAVLRDLETFARGDLSTYLELRLRPPSEAPTHVLWLGPAYPEPLPVATGPVAVVQQWNGEGVLLVLEKRAGHYRLVGEGRGRYWHPGHAHVAVFWVPYECSWPPDGVRCPRRYAGVVLDDPATRGIRLASVRYDDRGRIDRHALADLDALDGAAVLTLGPDEIGRGRLAYVTIDGVEEYLVVTTDGPMR